jgi:DeoR family fructose operon transcriptional repressor
LRIAQSYKEGWHEAMNDQQTFPRTLFAEERQSQILFMLQEKSKLHVADLCEHFSVSPATIRNDLRKLEEQRMLKRTHGGAIPVEKTAFEPNTNLKRSGNREKKRRIAVFAAGLVEDGDTIALDSGTTTMELARCLAGRKDITVLTNDVRIATFLENNSMLTVVLIGGILRHGLSCTVGPISTSAISSLYVDKVFLGTNAFSVEKGFSTPDLQQAEVKRALIRCASERIMLCDSSKFGRISFVKFAAINEIDQLITDSDISPNIVSSLQEMNDTLAFSAV